MTISSVNSDKSLTSNERIWKRAARYKEKIKYTKKPNYIRNNIIYVSMLGNNSIGIIREMSGHKKCCN